MRDCQDLRSHTPMGVREPRRTAARELHPHRVLLLGVVTAMATIHVLCETSVSLGTSVIDGLIAWATILSAGTAFGAGLPAAMLLFDDTVRAKERADQINRGIGVGFIVGVFIGPLDTYCLRC